MTRAFIGGTLMAVGLLMIGWGLGVATLLSGVIEVIN